MRRLTTLLQQIEHSWIGDAIGCACLCGTFLVLIVAAGVLQ